MHGLCKGFRRGRALLVTLAALTFTTLANAGMITWELTYTGGNFSADMVLTTTDILNGEGAYNITAATGTRNGFAVELLSGVDSTDNYLFPVDPFFSILGLIFQAESDPHNVYFDGDNYYEYPGDTDLGSLIEDLQVTQIAHVAEPTSLALLGLCALALGFSRRQARRLPATAP